MEQKADEIVEEMFSIWLLGSFVFFVSVCNVVGVVDGLNTIYSKIYLWTIKWKPK